MSVSSHTGNNLMASSPLPSPGPGTKELLNICSMMKLMSGSPSSEESQPFPRMDSLGHMMPLAPAHHVNPRG